MLFVDEKQEIANCEEEGLGVYTSSLGVIQDFAFDEVVRGLQVPRILFVCLDGLLEALVLQYSGNGLLELFAPVYLFHFVYSAVSEVCNGRAHL